MTASERAHKIRQVNPRISWGDAMKQAYAEIAKPEAEHEEAEAKQTLQNKSKHIMTRVGGNTMTTLNRLLADVIQSVVVNHKKSGDKYPWKNALNVLEGKLDPSKHHKIAIDTLTGGVSTITPGVEADYLDEINELMYDYSKGSEWDSLWRGKDGKIKSLWKLDIQTISKAVGVDLTSCAAWSDVSKIFS